MKPVVVLAVAALMLVVLPLCPPVQSQLPKCQYPEQSQWMACTPVSTADTVTLPFDIVNYRLGFSKKLLETNTVPNPLWLFLEMLRKKRIAPDVTFIRFFIVCFLETEFSAWIRAAKRAKLCKFSFAALAHFFSGAIAQKVYHLGYLYSTSTYHI